jgi:signal transduction histidine kinase
MLQSEKIDRESATQLQSMYLTVNRLSRLNKSLTLLTKLESVEYDERKKINLKNFILNRIDDYTEIAEAKKIRIKKDLREDAFININEDLLEILFSNLLVNAINHNFIGGEISLQLNNKELRIENTGNPVNINPERMFERFIKNDPAGESSGLGLTIVKRICELSGMEICYNYDNSIHKIVIKFHYKEYFI